ncbi:hypothetical protein GCM10008967_18560 [Bacillus carboniphilus]|uniref:NERD domain-containing protein n=1 Tax=Bacillus carboniphilus TaxID=86663 RepID=A0ABN0W7W4_9BACI
MQDLKPLVPSDELRIYRVLDGRNSLSEKDKQQLWKLERGFEGEMEFSRLVMERDIEGILLNDLLYEYKGSLFQVDKLLLINNSILLLDIKNHEDDYIIKEGKWHNERTGQDIRNPVEQLNRCETLLTNLLQDLGNKNALESSLVFVNPEFFLYNAPVDQPIIFPSQINRFLNKLQKKSLSVKKSQFILAEKLISLCKKENPFTRVPPYNFEELKKGVLCERCRRFMRKLRGRTLVCDGCGSLERVESAIVRGVKEFVLLFPEKKVTTNHIYEWCKVVESKHTIRRVLSEHFEVVGKWKSTHFIEKMEE